MPMAGLNDNLAPARDKAGRSNNINRWERDTLVPYLENNWHTWTPAAQQ